MNNPYITGFMAFPQIGLALFLFAKLNEDNLVLALVGAGFFGLGGLLTGILSAIRIPAWHQSRKIAKRWVAEHGGELPPELRWYT